jgi:hypothetical protein
MLLSLVCRQHGAASQRIGGFPILQRCRSRNVLGLTPCTLRKARSKLASVGYPTRVATSFTRRRGISRSISVALETLNAVILMKRQPYLRLEESPEILLRDVEPQTHFSDHQVLPGTKMLDIIQHLTDSFVLDRVRSAPYFRKCREKHRNTAIWNSLSVNIVELNT